jgi:alkyldihydroxyacetonephosphate synthase
MALPAAALEMLRSELGETEPMRSVELDEVALPAPRPLPGSIVDAVNQASVLVAHEQRVRRSAGRSYPDLVRLRGGRLAAAPDAVVMPGNPAQLADVLEICAREGIAVVPFGGGTSVVGGVDAVAGPHERVISLDLRRIRSVEIDRVSLVATLGPGLRGPEAEDAVRARGLTIGHFPQSFEYATVGGFAATRSAGQASSGYGRFDSLVTSVRLLAPAGEMATQATPHTAAGPALRELIVGSEGVLGVIPDVSVRVRPAPEKRRYEAWFAESFEAGAEIVRGLSQSGALPDVIRLSDEDETRVSLALSGPRGTSRALLERYLRLRGVGGGCILIVGIEGDEESVARRRALAVRGLRAGGAVSLGGAAGRAWEKGRYQGPYLRDTLMDMGALVETLETAHEWSGLQGLYERVREALAQSLAAQGTPGLVFCHLSHAYPDGASLYFTFIARARAGEEIEQWRAVKTAACEAILDAGGTITHHHAIGRDHAPYMEREVGPLGVDALRALKDRLDPAGIMNPGKLLP